MNKIRELRKRSGLTMKELGWRLGVAESTISLYENGKRQPDFDTVFALADLFHVSTDYLLGRSDNAQVINSFSTTNLGFPQPTNSVHNLSTDEKSMLELFNSLNADGQAQLLALAQTIAGNPSMQEILKSSSAS